MTEKILLSRYFKGEDIVAKEDQLELKPSSKGLAKLKDRMGVAGYSMFQPLVANKDDESRQRNRRVEIFVLAPDAAVAGWEPGGLQ